MKQSHTLKKLQGAYWKSVAITKNFQEIAFCCGNKFTEQFLDSIFPANSS